MLLGTAKLGREGDEGDGVVALTGLSAAVVSVPAPGTAGIMGRAWSLGWGRGWGWDAVYSSSTARHLFLFCFRRSKSISERHR